ncbi:hypothetical protein ASC75_20870 [Aminobacter sp. DSM 101952]|nr:hypothetical protein ASC75_20870 [Aminobacter sp. DSM 101952]
MPNATNLEILSPTLDNGRLFPECMPLEMSSTNLISCQLRSDMPQSPQATSTATWIVQSYDEADDIVQCLTA